MPDDRTWMREALTLARRGEGRVEPNPMVGCVLVRDGRRLAAGWHAAYGGPHAEAAALRETADARGSTAYVTLEPCCHVGKTPPCADALIAAGVRRVVVAVRDPFPQVDGGGIAKLLDHGVQVDVGILEDEARELLAPYLMLIQQSRPWIIAKWAMTCDGRIATHTGQSQWISNELSRRVVHEIRGRVDGILVGRVTVERDNPQLTARPAGPRMATRIVLDSQARLSLDSHLAQSAREIPVLLFAGDDAPRKQVQRLQDLGVEVSFVAGDTPVERVRMVTQELGRRRMTNVLVEGGGVVLGSLHDAGLIDEWHLFVAPLLIGGQHASSPLGGLGKSAMSAATRLRNLTVERLGDDIYLHGRTARGTH